ncbi:hypothetical protein M406DRAFT_75239 [Cryphonectria parasitica EP155]|uniref:Uncharacterized protein n=1 Tax=Cryphonectria parasitica (strain ATCC 38755 / EP155) TaxID=660469 RepID=A0A9P5CNK7_CRYP1|nr:uncharacterized protein M406DRAFT_75239 [Cryphonectria parasitica EP155]KAF3764015.1 hypothetical protein M406DRAFT_75239 [Cryphonectria parasitica EP155]
MEKMKLLVPSSLLEEVADLFELYTCWQGIAAATPQNLGFVKSTRTMQESAISRITTAHGPNVKRTNQGYQWTATQIYECTLVFRGIRQKDDYKMEDSYTRFAVFLSGKDRLLLQGFSYLLGGRHFEDEDNRMLAAQFSTFMELRFCKMCSVRAGSNESSGSYENREKDVLPAYMIISFGGSINQTGHVQLTKTLQEANPSPLAISALTKSSPRLATGSISDDKYLLRWKCQYDSYMAIGGRARHYKESKEKFDVVTMF